MPSTRRLPSSLSLVALVVMALAASALAGGVANCRRCGAALSTDPGQRFCDRCGVALKSTPVDPRPSASLVGTWVDDGAPVAVALGDDLLCHVACCRVLRLEPGPGGLRGVYAFTDCRRLYEAPGLHRSGLDELRDPQGFPVQVAGGEAAFAFAAHVSTNPWLRGHQAAVRRRYDFSASLTLAPDGRALSGLLQQGSSREQVTFRRVEAAAAAHLWNRGTRRAAIEGALDRVRGALTPAGLEVPATPLDAARQRVLRALANEALRTP